MAEKYTIKTDIPQYVPKGIDPAIKDFCNTKKYDAFISEIESMNIEDKELEQFLKLAATRFIEFNYAKIAEFYCHRDKEIQEIMEKMALVIIDFEDAIKYGYVQLSKKIQEIINKSNEGDEN